MLKVFEISGRLIAEDHSHHELLNLLYDLLKSKKIHFSGTTKDITEKYITNNK